MLEDSKTEFAGSPALVGKTSSINFIAEERDEILFPWSSIHLSHHMDQKISYKSGHHILLYNASLIHLDARANTHHE